MIDTRKFPVRRATSGTALFMAISLPFSALASRDGFGEMRDCARVKTDAQRLACFDAAALKLSAPKFEGRLGMTTEPFEVTGRTRLRYQSDGVIFVLYLKDANGEVLQNLHIGGGGEDSFTIEQSGTYRLQINGSEGWRVWIEPL